MTDRQRVRREGAAATRAQRETDNQKHTEWMNGDLTWEEMRDWERRMLDRMNGR